MTRCLSHESKIMIHHGASGKCSGLTDSDVAIGTLEHLIHALWPERGAASARHGLGCENGRLHGLDTLDPALLVLLLNQGMPMND